MRNAAVRIIAQVKDAIRLAVFVVVVPERIDAACRIERDREIILAVVVHVEPLRLVGWTKGRSWKRALCKRRQTTGDDQREQDEGREFHSPPLFCTLRACRTKLSGTTSSNAAAAHEKTPTATACPSERAAGTDANASETKPRNVVAAQSITALAAGAMRAIISSREMPFT